ncbi:ribbon-helix-helix protein, CopG family [Porticoccus sp. W117]|uniref:CopG family ribbon-helix-helix protein n=1 Tax=Porticoccus sp. W117 TaxID=3054777 RepID=UPI002592A1D6|nr:ribbon-helix-helix protein, CopG family [Porticoccus sp. W117]MDM3870510.1 ribbon-helix-helix protein, CopG family [Porticoccus sp. W117]
MLGVRLDEGLEKRLASLAEKTQRSKSYHAKEALRRYIQQEEAKEQAKQETLSRWQAYQESGEVVSSEAVTDWLNSWGEDKESQCPVK